MNTKVKTRTIYKWIGNDPELEYNEGDSKIFCKICEIGLILRKQIVSRHLSSQTHIQKKQPGGTSSNITFYEDFINFLVLVNIPWNKVNNPHFKYFFNKYICCACSNSRGLVDESSLRKRYLDLVFKKKMDYIREEIGDGHVSISVDEATDGAGRNVVNLLIRSLQKSVSSSYFLLASKIIDGANGLIIANFIIEELRKFWKDSFVTSSQKVALLTTNGVDYMLEAGKILKESCPNMLHVTCIANILHTVAEQIKNEYANVDTLITTVKKIFPKKPVKVRVLKQMYPKMPLPPKPDPNCLATWIEAAFYYQKYFNEIVDVLTHSPNNTEVSNVLHILKHSNVQYELDYICKNYGIIKTAADKLQSTNLPLNKSFEIFDEVCSQLRKKGSKTVKFKLQSALAQSPDYNDIKIINEKLTQSNNYEKSYYEVATLVSVDIEKSFSNLKWIFLSRNKGNYKEDNLTKLFFIYFNNQVIRDKEVVVPTQQKMIQTNQADPEKPAEVPKRPTKRPGSPMTHQERPMRHQESPVPSSLVEVCLGETSVICLDDDFDEICLNSSK